MSLRTWVFVLAPDLLWGENWSQHSLTKINTPLTGLLSLLDLRDSGWWCSEGAVYLRRTPSHLILSESTVWVKPFSVMFHLWNERKINRNVQWWGPGKYYAMPRLCQSDWNVKDCFSSNKLKFVLSLSRDLHRNKYLSKMDERAFAGIISGPMLL